jgi:hypothetical protein
MQQFKVSPNFENHEAKCGFGNNVCIVFGISFHRQLTIENIFVGVSDVVVFTYSLWPLIEVSQPLNRQCTRWLTSILIQFDTNTKLVGASNEFPLFVIPKHVLEFPKFQSDTIVELHFWIQWFF